MLFALIVVIELLTLLILSDRIGKILYTIFFLIFRSKTAAISLLTFLYLPGTAIHELAHLITAEVLRVQTGPISFTPQIASTKHGQTDVEIGSVKVAGTDPLRRYLIGIAPVIFGIFFLYLIIWLFQKYWPTLITLPQQSLFVATIGYLLFAVSNNMFSSKKDLEGFIFVVPVILILAVIIYVTGFRISLTGQALTITVQVLETLSKALGVVIGVNLCIFMFNHLILRGLLKILHIKMT